MSTLWILIWKDLKIFLHDRRAVFLSFLVPIVLASFMGMIFDTGGDDKPKSKTRIGIADQDKSSLSAKIIENLASSVELEVVPTTAEEARPFVLNRHGALVVVFPKGFGKSAGDALFSSVNKPELSLLYDPSRSMELAMIRGLLTQHIMQGVSQEVFGSGQASMDRLKEAMAFVDTEAGLGNDDKKVLRTMFDSILRWQEHQTRANEAEKKADAKDEKFKIGGFSMPYETRNEPVTARKGVKYNSYGQSFAGMSVQFVLFAAIEMGVGLLTERRQGIWKRLRAAPLSRAILLASRAISAAIIALSIVLVVFVFGGLVFGIRIEGSSLGFLLVALSFSLMSATFGLMIAALGNTPEASRGISIFAVLVLLMLGGAWVPSFVFPDWLRTVSLAMPTRWAVDGFNDMLWRGLGLPSALLTSGCLLGFALVFGVLAVAKFRWETE